MILLLSLSLASFYKDISENRTLNDKLLNDYDLKTIKSGTPIKNAPLLVTGPGTGLGCLLYTSPSPRD